MTEASGVVVLNLRAGGMPLDLIEDGEGESRAVVWPGMGARHRSVAFVRLGAAARTQALRHPGESAYYVITGSGWVSDGDSPRPIAEGAFIHVSPGQAYRLEAGDGLELFGGPCPPDPSLYNGHNSPSRELVASGIDGIRVVSRDDPELLLPLISQDARMILWPGIGVWDATMNYVLMQPGEENRPHAHSQSEDTIVILEGRGSIDDVSGGRTLEFQAGDVVHVQPNVVHAVRANRGTAIVSAGGPCPADEAFLRACGAELPERPAGS